MEGITEETDGTNTLKGGRRGSGVSVSINRGAPPSTAAGQSKQRPVERNFGPEYPQYQHGYPPSPYYMQSPNYPLLMNPPPLPTVGVF